MKLEKPNYFSDDDLQMELLYGPDGEFSPTSINFWTDIYPNILEAYLSNHQPDKNYQDIFVDSNFYPLGVNQILRLCTRCFTELFTACFEKDLTHCENVSLSDEDIETLRNKKGLLGALGKITSNLAPLGRFNYRTLLYTLSQFDSNIIKLNEHLPKELYQDFVKEIKTPFYMLSDITGIKEIRKEIDKIVFLQHPQAISKIKKPHGYRLQKGEHCRSMIIFDNVEFGKKNQELFWDLVSFPGAFITMETVFFLNCKFSANYVSDRNWMRSRAVFRNCLFEKEFAPSSWLRESWKFINCTINGKLDFRNSEFEYGLWIDGCRFTHSGSLYLDGSKLGYIGPNAKHKIIFKNTIFGGVFSMTKANFGKADLVMKNITFMQPFFVDETQLGKNAVFEDIGFSLSRNPRMETSKKIFAESLLKFGYKTEVEILGLLTEEEKTTEKRMSDIRYSSAYRTGWFNPEQTAIYLGKSKSWLAKKRMTDKKKPTKTSLPFVGQRKGILYPKRALEAYRLQDWNQLKMICKKYGIGSKEQPESIQGN